MKHFFDNANPFFRAMNVAFNLIIINLLTLLCSLPLVTIGTALAAANTVLTSMVEGQEGYPSRQFFQAFRKNLRQGVLSFLVFLLGAFVLGVDLYGSIRLMQGVFRRIFLVTTSLLIVIYAVILFYFYIFLSRYEDSQKTTLKNAAAASVAYFPRTVGMMVIAVAFLALYLRFFLYAVPFIILLGFSLPQYCCALLFVPIFQQIEKDR